MAPQEQQEENQRYQEEEEEEDDFSFPTTTSSPPRFIGSPRLWRSSSNSLYLLQNPPTKLQEENEPEPDIRKKINLLSYMKSKDGGNEENMDVIWEDLNYEEEICSFREKGDYDPSRKRRRMNMVKVGGGGGKRLSMVVLVNVLKKLFLLHNASRKLNG